MNGWVPTDSVRFRIGRNSPRHFRDFIFISRFLFSWKRIAPHLTRAFIFGLARNPGRFLALAPAISIHVGTRLPSPLSPSPHQASAGSPGRPAGLPRPAGSRPGQARPAKPGRQSLATGPVKRTPLPLPTRAGYGPLDAGPPLTLRVGPAGAPCQMNHPPCTGGNARPALSGTRPDNAVAGRRPSATITPAEAGDLLEGGGSALAQNSARFKKDRLARTGAARRGVGGVILPTKHGGRN